MKKNILYCVLINLILSALTILIHFLSNKSQFVAQYYDMLMISIMILFALNIIFIIFYVFIKK